MALPILLALATFPLGAYLMSRLSPSLADSRTGRLAERVTELLGGAAAACFALNVYLAVRSATNDDFDGLSRGEPIAYALGDALWQAGILLGAAAAVHLLAPAEEEGAAADEQAATAEKEVAAADEEAPTGIEPV